jgi:hypothetical protein
MRPSKNVHRRASGQTLLGNQRRSFSLVAAEIVLVVSVGRSDSSTRERRR